MTGKAELQTSNQVEAPTLAAQYQQWLEYTIAEKERAAEALRDEAAGMREALARLKQFSL